MYAKVLIIGRLIAVGAMIGVVSSPGIADEKEDLIKVYESCIIKKIEKCESLAELLYTSRSVTLRNYADVHDKKAEFLNSEREMLINAMLHMQLEPKRYKIDHFLDQQFYRYLAK